MLTARLPTTLPQFSELTARILLYSNCTATGRNAVYQRRLCRHLGRGVQPGLNGNNN